MNEPFIDATGPSLGALSVYSKSSDKDSTGNYIMKPVWRLYNHQGPNWHYAQAPINEPNDSIVIEGIWGSSRASGFIAFDDITFFGGSCQSKHFLSNAVRRISNSHYTVPVIPQLYQKEPK